jgi:hypothetical protein
MNTDAWTAMQRLRWRDSRQPVIAPPTHLSRVEPILDKGSLTGTPLLDTQAIGLDANPVAHGKRAINHSARAST